MIAVKPLLLAAALVLGSTSAVAGETCTLHGSVVSATNEPVAAAVVLTDSRSPHKQVAYTGSNGRFVFQAHADGRQQLEVYSAGRVPAIYEVDCATMPTVTTVLP